MAKTTDIKTADEVIQMITDVLAESDGEFIELIANQVLTEKVVYLDDSEFEVRTLN